MTELHRKTPIQERSKQTIETILDAATQVLQVEGEERFTTNRVAEKSGFSIGTLYQYFPNKNAIVEALAERERIAIEATVAKAISKADPHEIEDVIRMVVRTAINAFGRRRKLRKFVIIQMIRLNLAPIVLKSIDKIGISVVKAIEVHGKGRVRPLSEAASFVLTRAIMGAIRSAVLEDRLILDSQDFENELVRLALRFLLP
jgi:AcrR family transcriptional regulator